MKIDLEMLFARKNNTIIEVVDIINKNLLKSAFIIDDNIKLLGIVSDGDIRRAILKGLALSEPIEKIMTKNPLVAKEGISEADILEILMNKRIEIIPVLNNERKVIDYYHLRDFIKEEFLTDSAIKSLDLTEKVLVIGGAGYIGSTLVRLLLKNEFSVRVLDNLMFGRKSIQELFSNPKFEYIEGDCTKIEDLIPCLKNVKAVIHLAAIVGDPAGDIDPELTEETNFHSVKILGEFCKYYGIERLIFASTCSVYGSSKDQLLNENSPLNPVSLYAETKLKAEQALLKLKDENFHPCIMRLATVFGLSHRMRFDLVINLLTALAVKKKEISIFSGKQWRPFIHVKDVAKAIINILNQTPENISGEIFNIGMNENNFQIEEIGNLMNKIFPEIIVHQIKEKEDERSYRVSFDKAKNLINYKPEYKVADGIREIAKFVESENIDFRLSEYSNYKIVKYGIFDSIAFFD